jgi:hypothetical protein
MAALALLALSACAKHSQPVTLEQSKLQNLRVIGLPLFADNKRIDIRRENPVYGMIGISAKALQQAVREYHRIQYQDANPELHQYCVNSMRQIIKQRLLKLGYRVRDLDMTYWKAQSAYRKKDVRLKGVDALLKVRIKRFGYFSASPYKPYRPGMVVTADLISTQERKLLSSNVYNVGYDKDDISNFAFQVSYMTHIHVEDKRYFYRNFKALMLHAKASSKGLRFVAGVAGESVAGDLRKRSKAYAMARK